MSWRYENTTLGYKDKFSTIPGWIGITLLNLWKNPEKHPFFLQGNNAPEN
jgi:hypothetical protein